MSLFVLVVALVQLFDVCCALGPVRHLRPPSAHARGLHGRAGLESIQGGLANWGNATTPQNATIVPVVLSEDKLCVFPCVHSSAVAFMAVLNTLARIRRSYYTLISVGNATYRIALDTGSADLWLISSDCTTSQCSVPKYQLGFASPTFIPVNSNQTAFNVSFADTTSA